MKGSFNPKGVSTHRLRTTAKERQTGRVLFLYVPFASLSFYGFAAFVLYPLGILSCCSGTCSPTSLSGFSLTCLCGLGQLAALQYIPCHVAINPLAFEFLSCSFFFPKVGENTISSFLTLRGILPISIHLEYSL